VERAGPSIGIEQARRLVRELSPLAAGTVEWLGAGTDSAAVRVDDEWVVRFPLVPDAQATLATELALLPLLAPRLPVAVPRPEHVAERDGQLVFLAYRELEGQPLSDAALSALSPSARGRALDELAALLDAIHGVPVEPARMAGVSFALHKGAFHAAQQSLEGSFPRCSAPASSRPSRANAARSRTSSRVRPRRCSCTPTSSPSTCSTTARAARSPGCSTGVT